MQWDGDPWTESQVKLAFVAIFLAICCLITVALNGIHHRIVAQAPEASVSHLLFPSGAK
jgi:hypothetical protein